MAEQRKRGRGRPTKATDEKKAKVCELLMEGWSLRQAANAVDVTPATILNWLKQDEEFSKQYVRARQIGFMWMAEEMVEIADDGTNDWMLRERGDEEVEVINHEHVTRSKLRIDTRKWILAKMMPKVFGDRPVVINNTVNNVGVRDFGGKGERIISAQPSRTG